ncbi:sulfotransferase family protein [Tindallia californiensis]|uniref:Sulfotransferase family protein n=1 Tax=Tindallia californiensis TaxID=159292 RepID=A0A1H3PCC1_9FIRM|nr:sulfotransferase [Tindallia californiensis]SDY98727.1 Sulfotransferase family protein [Tindallia californiensis]
MTEKKFLFILGRGRSGTTLLSSILNANQEICIAPESLFIMNIYRKYRKKRIGFDKIDQLIEDIYAESRMESWSFTKKELRRNMVELIKDNRGVCLSEVIMEVYRTQAKYDGKNQTLILGDKNPHYSLFPRELNELFPDAYWIHIVRDPRGTVASYKNVGFDYNHTGLLAARWNEYNKSILKYKDVKGSKYIMVKFEDLIENPQIVQRDILEFIGIGHNLDRKVKTKAHTHVSKLPWHSRVEEGFEDKRIHAWKKALTKEDIISIENICFQQMAMFDYAISENKCARNFNKRCLLVSRFSVAIEKLLFLFPLSVRAKIISLYRSITR